MLMHCNLPLLWFMTRTSALIRYCVCFRMASGLTLYSEEKKNMQEKSNILLAVVYHGNLSSLKLH